MRTADFDFDLPPELIAQEPTVRRDQSRMLVLHRATGRVEHRHFSSLADYLRPGDVLVLNDSKVIPARLRGVNAKTGGRFELLLLEENSLNDWWAMMRPGKRARAGTCIGILGSDGCATPIQTVVGEVNAEGHRRLRFSGVDNILDALDTHGETPLPPYIARKEPGGRDADRRRYQTVYAGPAGSVAAPTAGLHFTDAVLDQLRSKGIEVCFLTLHVGLGTFAPVKADALSDHVMHEERFDVGAETARCVNAAKESGRRVIAVGTTSVRVLESVAARHGGRLVAGAGRTRIFIHPPAEFRIVDGMLTNFHLPRSTLLMLVSAFAAPKEMRGRDVMLSAYSEAIRERYRFFSYGDAMLIL